MEKTLKLSKNKFSLNVECLPTLDKVRIFVGEQGPWHMKRNCITKSAAFEKEALSLHFG